MTAYLDLLNDERIRALKEGDSVTILLTPPTQPPNKPKPALVVIPGGRDAKPPRRSMSEHDDALLEQRLSGHSARAVAKQFRCAVADVDAAVDRLPEITNEYRVRSLKLALEQMDRLMIPFWEKACKGDVAAGMLVVKICERKADLLGINSPIKIDPVQLTAAAQPTVSGTDRILAVLSQFKSNGSNGNDTNAPPRLE